MDATTRDKRPRPHTGDVGPIEPGPETEGPTGPLQQIVGAAPDSDREHPLRARLRRRGYRSVLLGLAALLAAALALLLSAQRTEGPPVAEVPWPSQVTLVRYLGIGHDGAAPDGSTGDRREFVIRIVVSNRGDHPVTVHQFTQPYAGMTVAAVERLPLTIPAGATRTIGIQATVHDCSRVPRTDSLAFLDVTLSNVRAIQTQSEILGDRYNSDLGGAIVNACPSEAHRPTGTPAGPTISPP